MRNFLFFLLGFGLSLSASAETGPRLHGASKLRQRPVADDFQEATQRLKKFLEDQKNLLDKNIKEQVQNLVRNLDEPQKLLEAINSLFFDDQLSVSAAGTEEEAFGKKLADFQNLQDRYTLIRTYTEGQKEYRDSLIKGIAEALANVPELKAISLSKALMEEKKNHLEAYNRVIANVEITGGKDTWCFTCNPNGEIGKGTGYTFEKAMNQVVLNVINAVNKSAQPIKPPVSDKHQHKKGDFPQERSQQSPPPRPEPQKKSFLPDHSRLQVPGLSSQGARVPDGLKSTVERLMGSGQVLLLGNPTGCPPCQRAAEFLKRNKIPFKEAPVRSNPDAGQLFRNLRGQKFPLMIHSDGKGGFIYRQPNW